MIKKAFLLIILMSASVSGLFAQDVIVLRDATEIEAKVITVGIDEISYKKWNFQDGPTYQLYKRDVFYIKYENGNKDVFNGVSDTSNPLQDAQKEQVKGRFIHRALFNVYGEVGCDFFSVEAGPSLNFSFGARIYDYVFAGLSVGVDALFVTIDYDWGYAAGYAGMFDAVNIPILGTVRGYYPVNENFSPFAELSIGPSVLIGNIYYGDDRSIYRSTLSVASGRFRFGAGMEWKRFVVGIGYDCIFVTGGYAIHMGYAKVGVRIGKLK